MTETVVPARGGIVLGIAGQSSAMAAWLVGVVGALAGSDVAWLAGLLGLVGSVLTIVACFRLRSRWGVFGPIAAVILIVGIVGAVTAFVAVPPTREWGKLGAFILATMILGGAWVLGHLVASIGLLRARVVAIGAAAVVVQSVVAGLVLLSAFAGSELWLLACAGAFVGHALLMIGLVGMNRGADTGRPNRGG